MRHINSIWSWTTESTTWNYNKIKNSSLFNEFPVAGQRNMKSFPSNHFCNSGTGKLSTYTTWFSANWHLSTRTWHSDLNKMSPLNGLYYFICVRILYAICIPHFPQFPPKYCSLYSAALNKFWIKAILKQWVVLFHVLHSVSTLDRSITSGQGGMGLGISEKKSITKHAFLLELKLWNNSLEREFNIKEKGDKLLSCCNKTFP